MPFQPEQLLKALYDTLPDPVVITNLDRIVLGVNRAALSEFLMREDELVGINSATLFASLEDADNVAAKIFSASFLDEQFHMRVTLRRSDGTTFPSELSVSRVLDGNGRRVGQIAVVRNISKMLEAETERLKIERILTSGLATIKEGFVVYDQDDRLLVCNEAYKEIYAISAPAIKEGASFEDILRYGLKHGQYPEAGTTKKAQEAFLRERLKRHRETHDSMIQMVEPDRWIQIEEKITRDGLRVGLRTDITNLRKIRSEAERLGRIIDAVAQEIYILDVVEERFAYANKGARNNLGYSMEELKGLKPSDVSSQFSATEMNKLLKPLMDGNITHVLTDDRLYRRDGSSYPARIRFEIMAVLEGVNNVIAFVEDISERIEIERELERRRYEFETLLRNIPDAITRAKPDTTLTYVNDRYATFEGLTPADMIGQPFADRIPEGLRANVLAHIAALTPDNPMDTFEQPMIDHKGQHYWFLWSNLMIFENGERKELVSVGRDITEGREARDRIARQSHELQLRNDALEQFAGIVSHDLKAPLRQIRLFAEMIGEDAKAGRLDELPALSGHVSEGVRRMERMVTSLLGYSRLAYQSLNPVNVSLSAVVSAAWANLSVPVQDKAASLSLRNSVVFDADHDLLVQLFQNLIDNSIKYVDSNQSPHIAIGATVSGDRVVIHIEDNGIGIASLYHDTVFGVFQRLHKDEKTYPGTGVGLALCRRIAESHGGKLTIDPSFEGGTRFVLDLPRTRF